MSHTSTAENAPKRPARQSEKPAGSVRFLGIFTEWPILLLLAIALLVLGVVWWMGRDQMPDEISIAAGPRSQAYERAGIALKDSLEKYKLHDNVTRNSNLPGSPANADALAAARNSDAPWANVAVVQQTQLGRLNDSQMSVSAVAPLFHSTLYVAVDKELLMAEYKAEGGTGERLPTPAGTFLRRAIARLLREHLAIPVNVSAGRPGSGAEKAALKLRNHYSGPFTQEENADFSFVGDRSSPIQVRQTAWMDEDLLDLLRQDELELVPIDAGALAQLEEYEAVVIPAGAFGDDANDEAIPYRDINSVGSTDYAAVRSDAPDDLVTAILDAIYLDSAAFVGELNERSVASTRPPIRLVPPSEILTRHMNSSFHPAAQAYFQPFDPSELATWTEFLAGSKDLLVAIAASVFLLYGLRVRILRRAEGKRVSEEKEVLDDYLMETIRLEKEQWNCRDPDRLEKILAEITAIKIEALDRLTHEDLRSDRIFSIFLAQCANVMSKVQMKILAYRGTSQLKDSADADS